AYGVRYLSLHGDPARTTARFLLLVGFVALIWKQGFTRLHMPLFFVSALLPVVAFPALLDDPPHRRGLLQVCLACAGLLCLVMLHRVGPHMARRPAILRHTSTRLQGKLWHHYHLFR